MQIRHCDQRLHRLIVHAIAAPAILTSPASEAPSFLPATSELRSANLPRPASCLQSRLRSRRTRIAVPADSSASVPPQALFSRHIAIVQTFLSVPSSRPLRSRYVSPGICLERLQTGIAQRSLPPIVSSFRLGRVVRPFQTHIGLISVDPTFSDSSVGNSGYICSSAVSLTFVHVQIQYSEFLPVLNRGDTFVRDVLGEIKVQFCYA